MRLSAAFHCIPVLARLLCCSNLNLRCPAQLFRMPSGAMADVCSNEPEHVCCLAWAITKAGLCEPGLVGRRLLCTLPQHCSHERLLRKYTVVSSDASSSLTHAEATNTHMQMPLSLVVIRLVLCISAALRLCRSATVCRCVSVSSLLSACVCVSAATFLPLRISFVSLSLCDCSAALCLCPFRSSSLCACVFVFRKLPGSHAIRSRRWCWRSRSRPLPRADRPVRMVCWGGGVQEVVLVA